MAETLCTDWEVVPGDPFSCNVWQEEDAVCACDQVILEVTSDITLTDEADFIQIDATDGDIVITLPTAIGIGGHSFTFKRIDASANLVTINTQPGQFIDDLTSMVMISQWEVEKITSNNANYLQAS